MIHWSALMEAAKCSPIDRTARFAIDVSSCARKTAAQRTGRVRRLRAGRAAANDENSLASMRMGSGSEIVLGRRRCRDSHACSRFYEDDRAGAALNGSTAIETFGAAFG